MKCINFDEHFADYTSQWMKEHGKEYKNYDAMEADMPRVYMNFLNTPAKWLDGVTPGAYFTQFEDAKVLVDWLEDYCRQGVPVPDLLMDQIQTVGRPCEKRLVAILKDDEACEEAKMTAIGLLREMESTAPKMLYIQWQLNRGQKDELKDNALESLAAMGKEALPQMLQELPHANDAGKEALLDVLSNFPGNEQVFQLALRLFRENPTRRALFAGYLGKLGDERALDDLMKVALDDTVGYLDFIELRNAIEELGGVAPEREFDNDDPDYAALQGME